MPSGFNKQHAAQTEIAALAGEECGLTEKDFEIDVCYKAALKSTNIVSSTELSCFNPSNIRGQI